MRWKLRWGALFLLVALFADPSRLSTALERGCEFFQSRFTTQTLLETLLEQPNSIGYAGIGSLQEAGMQDSFVLIKITSPTNESHVVEPNTKTVGAGLAEYLVNLHSPANSTDVTPDASGQNDGPNSTAMAPGGVKENEENVEPWPITALTFVAVYKDWPANECEKARAIYDFLIWCSESPNAARVAEKNQFSAVPKASKTFAQDKINSMTCNNQLVRTLPVPSRPVEISAAGSSLAGILFTQLSIEYNFEERWNVVVSYDATGSGAGFDLAESRVVDFAASDRPTSEADLPNGHEWLFVSLYATAVVVMANVPFAPSLLMTQEMVSDVFTAQIVCWNDPRLQALNPEVVLPAEAIRRTVRNLSSGTTSTFTASLAAMSGLPRAACLQHPLQCSSNPSWPQPNLSHVAIQCPCTPAAGRAGAAQDLSWLRRNQGTVGLAVLAGLLALAALAVLVIKGLEHKDDKLWRVHWNEVGFPEPAQVLGQGSFGVVTKAVFRGDFVACKRLLSPAEAALALAGGARGVASRRPQIWDANAGTDCPDVGQPQPSPAAPDDDQEDVVAAVVARRGVGLNRETRRQLMSEVKVMVHVRHANVCPLMGACLEVGREFLLMQFFEYGSIRDMMNNRFPLTRDIQLGLVSGIAAGMQYLHLSTPALIHKDLKTANVLVDVKLSPKVSDFGMASTTSKIGERVGTLFWNAPELLQGQGASTASDVYAFAVTAYEIFHPLNLNIYPPGLRPADIIAGVRAGLLRPVIDKGVMPHVVESLIQRCWAQAPLSRPSFTAVLADLASEEGAGAGMEAGGGAEGGEGRAKGEGGQSYAMFPPQVAALLRAGLKVQPRRHQQASLLFADLNTSLPLPRRRRGGGGGGGGGEEEEMEEEGEEETCEEGREEGIHKVMARMAAEHGLFQVRTIGGSFLAAAGLPEPQEDHAARVAAFATELMLKAEEMAMAGGHVLRLRVGCHSGPVVASVVGNQTLRYCLLGPTVNLASRLELAARPHSILVSAAMRAKLLKHNAPAWRHRLVPRVSSRREEASVGGSELHTNSYWLLHRDPSEPRPSPPGPSHWHPLARGPGSPFKEEEEEEEDGGEGEGEGGGGAEGTRSRRVLFSDSAGPGQGRAASGGAGHGDEHGAQGHREPASGSGSARRGAGNLNSEGGPGPASASKRQWFLPTLYRDRPPEAVTPEQEAASDGEELELELQVEEALAGPPRQPQPEAPSHWQPECQWQAAAGRPGSAELQVEVEATGTQAASGRIAVAGSGPGGGGDGCARGSPGPVTPSLSRARGPGKGGQLELESASASEARGAAAVRVTVEEAVEVEEVAL